MGLDMHLNGSRCHLKERANRLKEEIYELGYWRKHPDLHGYIVENFANGEYLCQEIGLSKDDLLQIIAAVKGRRLPTTAGFFFGTSENNDEQVERDVRILRVAISWLEEDDHAYRCVSYRASW